LSAQAGEVTVTGSAELTYTQRDEGEITGNPIGMNKNIAFAGSGELDNGWTVSISQGTTDAMGFSSASVTIGMGSLGSLTVDGGTGADIGNSLDNVMPTAFEEADAGFATGLVDSGGVIGNHGSLKYSMPEISGAKIYLGYIPRNNSGAAADGGTSEGKGESAYEIGVDWSPEMVPGLRVGGVMGDADKGASSAKDLEEETWFATYAYGPLTIGYQVADEDNGLTSYDTDIYGVSFNINDALSVSYQYGETDGYANGVTAKFEGISAAYNIGPMAIKFTDNDGEGIAGTSGSGGIDHNRELNLSMSF
jgi:hypothetical protein